MTSLGPPLAAPPDRLGWPVSSRAVRIEVWLGVAVLRHRVGAALLQELEERDRRRQLDRGDRLDQIARLAAERLAGRLGAVDDRPAHRRQLLRGLDLAPGRVARRLD